MNLVGKKAAEFTLLNQEGKDVSLSDFAGKYVLLYFYPKDMTPGCTTEACGFRDLFEDLKKNNTVILGVSADGVEKHKQFETKHKLNFDLLADTEKKVIKAFGVLKEKSMFGKTFLGIARDSFLIDPEGVIVKHYKKVKPKEHPANVLKDIQELSS